MFRIFFFLFSFLLISSFVSSYRIAQYSDPQCMTEPLWMINMSGKKLTTWGVQVNNGNNPNLRNPVLYCDQRGPWLYNVGFHYDGSQATAARIDPRTPVATWTCVQYDDVRNNNNPRQPFYMRVHCHGTEPKLE